MDAVGDTNVASEANYSGSDVILGLAGGTVEPSVVEDPQEKPKRKRVRCPIGKKPKRVRVSGPMVGVKIDSRTKRRLRRAKAAVEFASGETYMMSDLMTKVVSKGLDVVERELKIVDSASPTPSFLSKPTDSDTYPIDVKPMEATEPMEGLS